MLGIWARWVVLGHVGLRVGGRGVVWDFGGLARVGFGLGWEGFWVEAWGFWVCIFGVWGGTGRVNGLTGWYLGIGELR